MIEGLNKGMEKYLRRGVPKSNTTIHEVEAGEGVKVDELPTVTNGNKL
jgi:hypothetical protein